MPSSIVTYVHRQKRPPRKRAKAAALTGSAIVRPGVKAENDHRPNPEPKSQIVQAIKPARRKTAGWVDDGSPSDPEVKAFLARMIRPGGALPPEKP